MFKKIAAVAAACFVMATPFSALAEGEVLLNAAYETETGNLKFTGKAGSKAAQAVTLYIMPAEADALTFSLIESKQAFSKVTYTGADGAIEESFSLGDLFASGKYKATIRCDEGEAQADFMYVNRREAASIMAQLNAATTQDNFCTVLLSGAETIGIDPTTLASDSEFIGGYLFAHRPTGGYDNATLVSEYGRSLSALALIESDADLEAILLQYEAYTTVDYKTEIGIYDEAVINALREQLRDTDYLSVSLDDVLRQNLLLARCRCAERYTVLRDVLQNSESYQAYDLTAYNALSDSDAVWKYMFNNRSGLHTFADIETLFDKAVEAAKSGSKTTTSGGSGGGGGGGVSSLSSKAYASTIPTADLLEEHVSFTDLDSHWAADSITYFSEKHALTGYGDGSFRPNGAVTRAEFIKLLMTMSEEQGEKTASETSFADVAENDWYAPYVMRAVAAGIVTGADGYFHPNSNLTRQDAAVILHRYASAQGTYFNRSQKFNDDSELADYAAEAVGALAGSGVINGENNMFYPTRSITRGEAVTMLVRLEKMGG